MSIALDQTLHLQIALNKSATVSQPEITVSYIDWTPDPNRQAVPATSRSSASHSGDVTILSAPVNNPSREIIYINIYNKDTVAHDVIVKTDNGTSEMILTRQSLSSTEALIWTKGQGWQIF